MGTVGIKASLVYHKGVFGPMSTVDYERARFWKEHEHSSLEQHGWEPWRGGKGERTRFGAL